MGGKQKRAGGASVLEGDPGNRERMKSKRRFTRAREKGSFLSDP